MAGRPAENRKPLLDAALQEFSLKGFAGARIDTIAAAAKANKQLVYHYFESKQGLYTAVFEEAIKLIRRSTKATDEGLTLENFIAASLKSSRTRIGRIWIRLLMFEGLEFEPPIHREAERRWYYNKYVDAIRRAQNAGEWPADLDPGMSYLMLWAMISMPKAMPQVTELVMGMQADSLKFHREWSAFMLDVARRMAPDGPLSPT